MLENNDLQVTSVEIAPIKASGMGPTIDSEGVFQLNSGKKSGTVSGIEILNDPSSGSSLIAKLMSTLINKVRIRINVQSTLSKNCSIFIFNTGNNFRVNFGNTDQQYEVPGPTVVIINENIHVFDGKKSHIMKGIVKAGTRLDMLVVDSALTILSTLKRNGIKLFIPDDGKELSMTVCFNTTLDILKQKNIGNDLKSVNCISRL